MAAPTADGLPEEELALRPYGEALRLRGGGRHHLAAIRVHGAPGYSAEGDVSRYYRDAPLMIVGEGTNEIQRNVIVCQLVARSGGDGVG